MPCSTPADQDRAERDRRFSLRVAQPLRFAPLALAVLALTGSGCTRRQESAASSGIGGAAKSWNLVLISIDTLRADRLNSFGYQTRETSPEIDRLAISGVRFGRAHAPRASTWPSLASVLTGLYPSGHGLLNNGYHFADDQVTLPRLLQDAGYETGAFLSNMCQANHRGYSELFCTGGVDKRLNRHAIAWLEGLAADRPFFLWAHYFGAHPPYYNGGDLARSTLDPGYRGDLAPRRRVLDRVMKESIALDAADQEHLQAIYDAAVIGSDRWIGELLRALEERVDLERTVIVLLADHGEDLYQHNGYLYHACSVYQTSLHVPLAFVAPGLIDGGATVSQNVELVDVLPTILELLDIAAPSCLDGASLVPYLERPERSGAGKPAYSEYSDTRIRTFTEGWWKVVTNPEGLAPRCFPGGPEDLYPIAPLELYDLGSDPLEQQSLAADEPSRVAELLERLEEHTRSLCGPREYRQQEIPPALQRELEAMGYVASGGD